MRFDNEDAIFESSALHPLEEEVPIMVKKIKHSPVQNSRPRTLLEDLVAAVGAYYARDPSTAGVVISKLRNGSHYVSVVRYEEEYGRKKKTICLAELPDLREALRECAEKWQQEVSCADAEISRLRLTALSMKNVDRKTKKK